MRSRGSEPAGAEQVHASTTIALSLDQFEAIHMPFRRAVAPRRGECCSDCRLVLSEAGGAGLELADAARRRLLQPRFQRLHIAGAHEAKELYGELSRDGDRGAVVLQ